MGYKMNGFSGFGNSPAKNKSLYKKSTGPRATVKPEESGKRGGRDPITEDVPLSPGFEDPIKIQKVQREGLVPGPRMADKAFLKSQNESEVKRSDFEEGSEQQKMFDRNKAKSKAKKSSPNKLMGLVKKKVNKELETPAGQMAAKAATGGMA